MVRPAWSLPPVVAACFIKLLCQRGLTLGGACAFLCLLLQGNRLQTKLVILHCGRFQLQPRGQISNFLGCGCGRQTCAQLVEPLRPRSNGGADIFCEASIDANVARIEIKSRARLLRACKAKTVQKSAIDFIGLRASCANYIKIAISEPFERCV